MQKRTFGALGYEVSALGLGCMRLPRLKDENGNAASAVDLEKAFELIQYAADNGINYFDTAFTYHAANSESVLGEALSGGRRERVKIATKQPLGVMKTRGDIRRNLESTLKKLRTDYIDVYLMHNIQGGSWDDFKKIGAIEEYESFRREGLIKAIGFSFHGDFNSFKRILGDYDWEMCQVQQNMLDVDREATEEGVKMAGEKGCALVIMEPLRGGGLVNAPPNVREIYDAYNAENSPREPREWAFRHLINYPQVSTVLSGMTTLEQLKENIELFSREDFVPHCLSEYEKDVIAQARAAYKSIVTIPCTGCRYCVPCPKNVDIPNAFSLYNEGMMFGAFDQPKRSYSFSTKFGSDATNCVECGVCVKKCPQFINIPEQLKVAHEGLKGWVE